VAHQRGVAQHLAQALLTMPLLCISQVSGLYRYTLLIA
jgi:hypothetical protein